MLILGIESSELALFLLTAVVGYAIAKVGGLIAHLRRRADMPRRCRVYKSHHFDSTCWDDFKPRSSDIFIVTAYKSGTTWMQQIVAMLLWQGEDPPAPVAEISPWVDSRLGERKEKMAAIEAQTHRRFLKTHLPADAMPYYPEGKYIYVGRDGRDAFMSLHNHYEQANDSWYAMLNDAPGRAGPPLPRFDPETMSPPKLFDKWLSMGWETHNWEQDGWPWWSLFYNMSTWWEWRHKPNILMCHFANLKADLPGEMRRVAAFLQIPIDEARFPDMVRKCTFEYMRNAGATLAPAGGGCWDAPTGGSGAQVFFHKGTNRRWEGVLSAEQIARYEAAAKAKLPAECAHWLATGELPAEDAKGKGNT